MYDGDAVSNVVDVACSWSAISTAIGNVTTEQANNGTLIRVADGTLSGNGTGESATAVVSSTGSSSWTQRVTVAPKNGYGSVTVDSGARFHAVDGVCWAGFKWDDRCAFTACVNGAVAWGECNGFYIYGDEVAVTDQFEVVELVDKTSSVVSYDPSTVKTSGGNITNCKIVGCYLSPNFIPDPLVGDPHVDTIQLVNTGGGAVSDLTFEDCIIYASNNAAVQTGNTNGLDFDHSCIFGGARSKDRYPIPSGGYTGSTSSTFSSMNGAGQAITFANDSYCFDPWTINTADSATPLESVSSSTSEFTPSGTSSPVTGSWTVDGTITADSIGIMAEPSDDELLSLWGNGSVPVSKNNSSAGALL
jgi:hypothetical protein